MTTAIKTKFLGPTNHRAARVSAETLDTLGNDKVARIVVDWNHACNVEQNHELAAKALAKKLNWNGQWISGGTHDGYVFVRTFDGAFNFEIERDETDIDQIIADGERAVDQAFYGER